MIEHNDSRGQGADASRPPQRTTTLDLMPIGARGVITCINGERRKRRRLMEMGLLEGSRLRVVKFAPTGDPIEIEVNDYFLSLRRNEAAEIVVRDAAPDS